MRKVITWPICFSCRNNQSVKPPKLMCICTVIEEVDKASKIEVVNREVNIIMELKFDVSRFWDKSLCVIYNRLIEIVGKFL